MMVVLSVLAVLGLVVALLYRGASRGVEGWEKERRQWQALYLAESGIAWQLYRERFGDTAARDSAGNLAAKALGDTTSIQDTLRFFLDTSLAPPVVEVDRNQSFLALTSSGDCKGTKAAVSARFGKAMDDSLFGAALTVLAGEPLEYAQGQVRGAVRCPGCAPKAQALPAGFDLAGLLGAYQEKRYYGPYADLHDRLGREDCESGNGSYGPGSAPDFAAHPDIAFNLGGISVENPGQEEFTLRGPGKLYAQQDIRIRGRVRLENVQLFTEGDIIFEDSVTGAGVVAFAQGNVTLLDRCDLDLQAVAGKDIRLTGSSRTAVTSVLLSAGRSDTSSAPAGAAAPPKAGTAPKAPAAKGGGPRKPPQPNAIRLEGRAYARGFLLAAGPAGRVVLQSRQTKVAGVVVAAGEAWVAGEVDGTVLAGKLRCGGGDKACLGEGRIDREAMPEDMAMPMDLGDTDRRKVKFKLLDWRRL